MSRAFPRLSAEAFSSALLAAAFLQALEGALPRIPLFPWLKPGISDAVVLPFLACYGSIPTAALLICRDMLGWLLAGQPFSGFIIGTLASAATFLLLGPIVRFALTRGFLGYVGAGVALTAGLNLAQLAAVDALFIRHAGFFFQIPAMLLWSALAGATTAVFAHKAAPVLEELWSRPPPGEESISLPADEMKPLRRGMIFTVSWLRLIPVLALPFLRVQILMFAVTGLIIFLRRAPDVNARLRPFRPLLKAWPLLVFQAWLYLFQGEGTFIVNDWVTLEGLQIFLLQAFRLFNVILIGPRLAAAFPRGALARSESPVLRGLALAWVRMPRLLASCSDHAAAFRRALRRGDVSPLLVRLHGERV